MGSLVIAVVMYIRAFFVARHKLALEAAALQQQRVVLKRKQPRPRLGQVDWLIWTTLRRVYSGWTDALIIVKPKQLCDGIVPASVLLWRWRSRPHGRPKVTPKSAT